MNNKFRMIGIKQIIRKEWMDRAKYLALSGMLEADVRDDMLVYLQTQKSNGEIGTRGKESAVQIMRILAAWFSPDESLRPFRDRALALTQSLPAKDWLCIHWAVMSASYPFWFKVALQVGRLLNLQDYVTQKQIYSRIKEEYGDRETVFRYLRYTLRSYVTWGVLGDTDMKGAYKRLEAISISQEQAAILYEAALYTLPEGCMDYSLLQSNPAFFPFQLPTLSANCLSQENPAIEVDRYSLSDIVKLRERRFH